MTDTTKVDLSREAVERLASWIEIGGHITIAATIRALLDAKEAAERERDIHRDLFSKCLKGNEHLRSVCQVRLDELTEARASAAAAWEALNYHASRNQTAAQAMSDPAFKDATEALRGVKHEAYDEGYQHGMVQGQRGIRTPNPYRHPKEASHG